MLFLARRPIPGRNTRGTFAICAAKLQKRQSATSVRSAFASRRSPEKSTKSRETRGHIGSSPVSFDKYTFCSVELFPKHASGLNVTKSPNLLAVVVARVTRLQVVLCFTS